MDTVAALSVVNKSPAISAGAPRATSYFPWLLGLHLVLLTVGSVVVWIECVGDEPFLAFIPAQALRQLGGSVALVALWLYLAGATTLAVVTRRVSRLWLFLLPWAAFVVYLLQSCPSDYMHDLIKFQAVRLP